MNPSTCAMQEEADNSRDSLARVVSVFAANGLLFDKIEHRCGVSQGFCDIGHDLISCSAFMDSDKIYVFHRVGAEGSIEGADITIDELDAMLKALVSQSNGNQSSKS